MLPKMVQKHDKKPNGSWNEFWMDFGTILAPFWEAWGAHGLHFWCQNRTFLKDPHQNWAQKLSKTSLLAPWRPKGMPKCPQGPQRPSFLRILVPPRDFFHKNWTNDHLFLPPKKMSRNTQETPKIRNVTGGWDFLMVSNIVGVNRDSMNVRRKPKWITICCDRRAAYVGYSTDESNLRARAQLMGFVSLNVVSMGRQIPMATKQFYTALVECLFGSMSNQSGS